MTNGHWPCQTEFNCMGHEEKSLECSEYGLPGNGLNRIVKEIITLIVSLFFLFAHLPLPV